jgi:ATP-dependent DNA helicase RecG
LKNITFVKKIVEYLKAMQFDLQHILAAGENAHVEFKTSFNHEAIISLNAFANTEGGTVFIGVSDEGTVVGTSVTKDSVISWVNEVKNIYS